MATTGIFVKMFVAESVILFLFPCPKFILGDLIYIYKKKTVEDGERICSDGLTSVM